MLPRKRYATFVRWFESTKLQDKIHCLYMFLKVSVCLIRNRMCRLELHAANLITLNKEYQFNRAGDTTAAAQGQSI